jgi:hypothetical protein
LPASAQTDLEDELAEDVTMKNMYGFKLPARPPQHCLDVRVDNAPGEPVMPECQHICGLPGPTHNTSDECAAALKKDNERVAEHNHILIGQLGERRLALDMLRRLFKSGNDGVPVASATVLAVEVEGLLRR